MIDLFCRLPIEIQFHNFSYLEGSDLKTFSLICKAAKGSSDSYLKDLAMRMQSIVNEKCKTPKKIELLNETLKETSPLRRIILLAKIETAPTGLPFSHSLICDCTNRVPLKQIIELCGRTLNQKDKEECTLLHRAMRYGRCNIVEALLKNKGDLHAKNKQGQTPLSLLEDRPHCLEKEKIACLLKSNALERAF